MIKGQGEFDDTKGIVSSHKYEERIQWLKKKIKGQGEFDDTKGIISSCKSEERIQWLKEKR